MASEVQLPTALLPNGLRAAYVSQDDLFFFYHEVFEARCYLQQGIALQPGATVVDIGANLGLFAMFAAEAVGAQGKVIAAEPIPVIYKALQYNIASFIKYHRSRGTGCGPIHPINAGVADGTVSTATFTFFPRAAGLSSMIPNINDITSALVVALEKSPEARDSTLAQINFYGTVHFLRKILPSSIFRTLARLYAHYIVGQAEAVSCKLLSVSEIIEAHKLTRLDLLKIDVERAELAVLRGISEHHWPLVQQVVLEVHDIDGRVDAVKSLLKAQGFDRVVCEQPQDVSGSVLFNVYGTRGNAD